MSDMTTAMAHEIIAQATKYSAFEMPNLPADQAAGMEIEQIKTHIKIDETAAKNEAVELINLARGAYDKGIRTDAIFEILFAAMVEPTADEPEKYKDVYERHGQALPAPSAAPSELDKSEADVADGKEEQVSVDINAIVPNYDGHKVADLKKAILAAAASGDLTPEEWGQIKAYESDNEERKSILSLEPEFKKPEPAQSGFQPTQTPGGAPDLSTAYQDGTIGTDRIAQESLSVPPVYQGDEPILPVDITSESDQDVSRLSMRFHSLEARTIWLASQEAGRRDVADHLAREAWADAFSHEFSRLKSDIPVEKQTTASAVENVRSEAKHLADIDTVVRTWRSRAAQHAAEARSLDALAEGYDKAQTRLSREQSRRERLAQTS